jgi:hypothetical protein
MNGSGVFILSANENGDIFFAVQFQAGGSNQRAHYSKSLDGRPSKPLAPDRLAAVIVWGIRPASIILLSWLALAAPLAAAESQSYLKLDAGSAMEFVIAPLIGGDGKTPLVHTNTHSMITGTFLQGNSAAPAVCHDGTRSFGIPAGPNGYFNDRVDNRGSL